MAFLAPVSAMATESDFTSPSIEPGIFRDGEVSRISGQFGAWTLVCDEVKRLHRRYCSLKTTVRTKNGGAIALATFSTGDDGHPAVLMQVPFGVALGEGIEITPIAAHQEQSGRSAKRMPTAAGPARHIPIAICGREICTAIWTLSAAEIDALNRGIGLDLRFGLLTEPSDFAVHIATTARQQLVEGAIAAAGFSQAVAASLR